MKMSKQMSMREMQDALTEIPGVLPESQKKQHSSMVGLLNKINKKEVKEEKSESTVDKMIKQNDGWKDARLAYAEMTGEINSAGEFKSKTQQVMEDELSKPKEQPKQELVEEEEKESEPNPKRTMAALKVIQEIVNEETTTDNAQSKVESINKILSAL